MEQQEIITAEEVFGSASQLVTESGEGVLSGVASLGVAYQIVTGVVLLLFTFILVRYADLVRYLVASSVSEKSSRSKMHIYAAELKNIEIFTSVIGAILLGLLMMRLSVMTGIEFIARPLFGWSAWAIGGAMIGGVALLMAGERLLLFLTGVLCRCNDVCTRIWHIKLLHFSLVMILLVPWITLVLLTEGKVCEIALYGSVAVCFISLILFVKETFLFFRAQRFSIFHWILYLCALEIFPLSLLLAPILRG